MPFDPAHWQSRLDALRAAHRVPGAALAVLAGGHVHELASGVLHRGTGVAATPDSVFQLGSVAKVYTATLVMRLAEEGALDLDAPVAEVLPGFAVPDPGASATVTPRRLLSHTGGISGDFTLDTGRGDDCLARYVAACTAVGQDCPPGAAVSYSSTGYAVLGRITEVVTGRVWDEALRELLLDPLGAERTATLPEEVLRFRAAMSHLGAPGEDPGPAPAWTAMPRSAGPYGGMCASAADVLLLARMHLDGGTAADGTRLLSPEAVAAMRRPVAPTPDRWTVHSSAWGLGWTLYDWAGTPGFGHDGATLGQYSYLRVVPGAGVAAVLLTNGGGARRLYEELFAELLGDLAGVAQPAPFGPPARPVEADTAGITGEYRREGVEVSVTRTPEGTARMRYAFVDGMAGFAPPFETDLVPVEPGVFAVPGMGAFSGEWMPVVFTTLADGTACVYIGMRAAPRVG
ncbi:serine hydrolase domain-containing protein [Streptomonospora nanhaiensis]|uniref:serine hydrolase domain-containing protein n=1 Tax=Streptomonospora nanhaiensis TaxID=1323731 RepID=UPI001C99B1F3|nr:serine hydrolase domain-containing protein [Streptomonospora nanhaiensis]MBX9388013.1 beta-lactamase family protein [Streptomonospora nanhaiensis]